MNTEPVKVFVPAHVTGFFSIHRAGDPVATGSRGAGITLTDGVTVSVAEAQQTTVLLDGKPVSIDAVDRVVQTFGETARIVVETDVPLGAGFGVSGAIALGTAMGLNAVYQANYTENQLARIAHIADVEAGTGLGDVVAQLRGGVPIRRAAGGPETGTVDAIAARGQVEYLCRGALSTADILAEEPPAINAAGETALDHLLDRPTMPHLMEASRRFGRETELVPDALASIIVDVQASGGEAAMAMLGRTVFALDDGLTAAGYDPEICAVDVAGMRLV